MGVAEWLLLFFLVPRCSSTPNFKSVAVSVTVAGCESGTVPASPSKAGGATWLEKRLVGWVLVNFPRGFHPAIDGI